MPPGLTETRLKLLRLTAQLARQHGAPTPADLTRASGLSKQAVSYQLGQLREQGYVEPGEGGREPVRLTEAGRRAAGDGLPLVGEVAAGQPTHAEQHIERLVSRLDEVLDTQAGDFLLRVRGDSMIRLGIFPGDLVAVRPCQDCPSGEIAVVLLPGEQTATLKRLYRQGKTVELVSENPEYPPMRFPSQDVRVQGVLIGHIGDLKARRAGGR